MWATCRRVWQVVDLDDGIVIIAALLLITATIHEMTLGKRNVVGLVNIWGNIFFGVFYAETKRRMRYKLAQNAAKK
jgi:hypothetical protein